MASKNLICNLRSSLDHTITFLLTHPSIYDNMIGKYNIMRPIKSFIMCNMKFHFFLKMVFYMVAIPYEDNSPLHQDLVPIFLSLSRHLHYGLVSPTTNLN